MNTLWHSSVAFSQKQQHCDSSNQTSMEGHKAVTGIQRWVLAYATEETANVMGYFII